MVDVVHKPIEDESRDAHMATHWFLWFWHRAYGTHTPDFLTLPIEWVCCTMVEWAQFITFASSRRGSLWINVLKRSSSHPEGLPERGVSPMSKWSSLKRESQFLPCSLRLHCPHTQRKCFWPPPLLSPLYWTQREEYVGNVSISPLGTPFSSIHVSSHYLQMTKLQYVNSSTIIELQIKNDNR